MLVLSNDELMAAIEYAVVICRQTCHSTEHHKTMQVHLRELTAEQNRRAMEHELSSTQPDAGHINSAPSNEGAGPASAVPEAGT